MALICCYIGNSIYRGKNAELIQPWDIFPGYGWNPDKNKRSHNSAEAKLKNMLILNAAYGGKVVEKTYGA